MKTFMLKSKDITFKEYLNRRTMLLMFITVVIISFIFYSYCTHIQINNIKNTIKRVAVSTQYIVDVEKHQKINNMNSKEYKEMCQILTEYRSRANVYDIYTLIKKDDQHTKIVLASYDAESTFMEDYIFSNTMKEAYYKGKITITDEPYTDELGTFYTGYAPLHDSKGNVVALVAVDFSADEVISIKKQILNMTIILFVFMLFLGFIINYISAKPINKAMNKLNNEVQMIVEGDLNVRCDNNLINIKEFKEFIGTFNEMAENLNFLMGVISKNSKDLEHKSNHIGELVNKANTSAQIISSIVEQMCEAFKNVTHITTEFVEKNLQYGKEDRIIKNEYEERYIKLVKKSDELGNSINKTKELMKKVEIIYFNTQKEDENKVLKKYIDTIGENIINIDKLKEEISIIVENIRCINNVIEKDEYDSFNRTIIQEFNGINDANVYISEGIEEQAKSLEGIVGEIYKLKEMASDLNSNLEGIKIKEQ